VKGLRVKRSAHPEAVRSLAAATESADNTGIGSAYVKAMSLCSRCRDPRILLQEPQPLCYFLTRVDARESTAGDNMMIAKTIEQMRSLRRERSGSVGLVPTMGYLHEGHLSLVRQARAENAVVVVSIFVNPTQFGPQEDYTLYPRDPNRDHEMLRREFTDVVFTPPAEEMYPSGFNSWVIVKGVTERLEGACRPGHFQGVTTIVAKLFNIVAPHRAYFGQKDAQQTVVIKKMARDLNMDLEIIIMPTVRESDGLAMSSRNVYLNSEERRAAPVLFRALSLVQKLHAGGESHADRLRERAMSLLHQEPLARVDYFSVADRETLEELSVIDRPALISLALRIGKVRLIDNVLLEHPSP
jgi:pantoate--beta-alanine ligase